MAGIIGDAGLGFTGAGAEHIQVTFGCRSAL
jgi:hypothetical protein